MGGTCSSEDLIANLLKDNPFTPGHSMITGFYLMQMAWRLGDLLLLFTTGDKRANDFSEALLHHVVALFLVLGSYLANIMPMGSLIMVYHDVCDIFSSGVRVLGDSDYNGSNITLFVYISFLAAWMHLRVFLLPQLVY